MGNTKIVVLRSKEVLYTLLFFALFLLLLVLFFFMFLPSIKSEEASAGSYTPGVYNSQLSLNDTTLNIEVVVDENHINSVRLVNIDESVATMYPLMEPAMESISEQLCNNVALEDVVLSDSSKYTQTMLLQAVEETLEKAAVSDDDSKE